MTKGQVVSLFDASGLAVMPWAEAGYDVYCYDLLNDGETLKIGKGSIKFIHWNALTDYIYFKFGALGKVVFVCGFPPCTDLAVSGAAWFETKRLENPKFQKNALDLALIVKEIGERFECPWFFENPVSVISTLWRRPDHIFHPYEYGGYLPEDDVHPIWPEYINARDAYPKKTCYWSGGGFVMPEKKPIKIEEGYSIQHRKLGGKSKKTKSIRSMSPRGIGIAVFKANNPNQPLYLRE